jgi:hypothetical protein
MAEHPTKFIIIVTPQMQNQELKHAPKPNIQLHAPNRECVLPVKLEQK